MCQLSAPNGALTGIYRMIELILTAEELRELTGYRRPTFQVRTLRALGIRHALRPDGTVVVLRGDLERSPRTDATPLEGAIVT